MNQRDPADSVGDVYHSSSQKPNQGKKRADLTSRIGGVLSNGEKSRAEVGRQGRPGSVRYCAGSSIPAKSAGHKRASWTKERLVAVDDEARRLSYEIVESNIGFESYVSTVRISEISDDGADRGRVIERSFAVDPVEGSKFEDLVKKYEVALQSMAERTEDSFLKAAANYPSQNYECHPRPALTAEVG
ncbi:hypothetical protein Nepgr_012636 [Nepenthes gracilis]|uniref:Uncharacterized protein n=1 Tax=Nepenthes gracilis TaxID=150966 RepID=A0AAD3SH99_NEPGR|nr:hypothetical protein Nepgr_012636 [Nepenthes gracilis]